MKPDATTILTKTRLWALSGALMVGLAACDMQSKADNPGKNFDNLVESAGRDRMSAPTPAAPGTDQSGSHASDAMLEARVKAALSAEPGLRSVTVDVKSDDGVITLYGTADTPANSHRAAMVAMNVDGVRSVRNEMVVIRRS